MGSPPDKLVLVVPAASVQTGTAGVPARSGVLEALRAAAIPSPIARRSRDGGLSTERVGLCDLQHGVVQLTQLQVNAA